MNGSSPEDTEEAQSWTFDVDDVDEDGVVRDAIEPGEPTAENALFVLLGVAVALGLLAGVAL
jgi:hypothetical protein